MSVQTIYDINGEPPGVFILIEQGNEITKNHKYLASWKRIVYAESTKEKIIAGIQ